jgi:hypothetical protein
MRTETIWEQDYSRLPLHLSSAFEAYSDIDAGNQKLLNLIAPI